jgi:hypothetical protein
VTERLRCPTNSPILAHGTPRRLAERFIEEVRGDDADVAAKLRIEERAIEAGGPN